MFDSMVSVRAGDSDRHLGLGLYIARLIAVGHGGNISADNVDGGVRFTVAIPVTGTSLRRHSSPEHPDADDTDQPDGKPRAVRYGSLNEVLPQKPAIACRVFDQRVRQGKQIVDQEAERKQACGQGNQAECCDNSVQSRLLYSALSLVFGSR